MAGQQRWPIVLVYRHWQCFAPIKVADLARTAPQSFSRFFRGATGRTFVSFVNELRIEEACKQLASTTNDIIDIAYECGYGNLSNFNRRFSQIQKCTPSEYRKKHLQRRA